VCRSLSRLGFPSPWSSFPTENAHESTLRAVAHRARTGCSRPSSLGPGTSIRVAPRCCWEIGTTHHAASRCSQPWRVVAFYRLVLLLARSIAIHLASSGSQGWRQVLCRPLWVCWVEFPVMRRVGKVGQAGLQGCVGAYLAGILLHGSPGISLHPPSPN
jgi:hypothetical protein